MPLPTDRQTVLVTGANGFVGRAVVARLATDSRFVVRVTTRRRTSDLPQGVFQVHGMDLEERADFREALQGAACVVHAAARVHVNSDSAQSDIAQLRRTNVEGTQRLAEQAANMGVRRVVFVSSVKVNGEWTHPGMPFRPFDTPAPEDAYAVSKTEAEERLFALGREMAMQIVVVRPPLVYGPGVRGNFARMLHWAAQGVPLPLGAVHNRRSLVGLDNLVDLLVSCVDHPAAANQVFLAGDGEDLSTAELLRRVAVAMGKPPRLLPVSPGLLRAAARAIGRDEMARRLLDSLQVDISHTRKTLGWEPPVSVDEGLRRAVAPLLEHGR